jgi:Ni/Fe-hydrogenase subunit HybB-like protein
MEGIEGFVSPKETVINWDLLIVLYPYITGLVAGASIVSAFYHVFGVSSLKPVARFSLLVALAFVLFCSLPLLVHAGHPTRALEMYLTPNLQSAMSMFGYIWGFYLICLLLEIWLIYWKDIVHRARTAEKSLERKLFSVLALGIDETSDESAKSDEKAIKILAGTAMVGALLLHGYVGFIFGGIKANPWWSTPLMPIIFLLSAIVSGLALLIVMYFVISKIRRVRLDYGCFRTLLKMLLVFQIIDTTVEVLDVASLAYLSEESWEIISELIVHKIGYTFFGVQMGLGSAVPLILLGSIALFKFKDKVASNLGTVAACLVLIGVFAMRWNVIIGGQLFSKNLKGFTEYTPELLGREGILMALGLLALPFIAGLFFGWLLPPWRDDPEPEPTQHGTSGQGDLAVMDQRDNLSRTLIAAGAFALALSAFLAVIIWFALPSTSSALVGLNISVALLVALGAVVLLVGLVVRSMERRKPQADRQD